MDRRTVLTAVGTGLAGIAGCLSGTDAERSTETDVATDSEADATTATATSPALGDVVVAKATPYASSMGSGGVLTDPDRQYVVAGVDGVDPFHDLTFVFETAGETWEPGLPETTGARNRSVAGVERPYVAFSVPSPLSATEPRISLTGGGGEWPLSVTAAAQLAEPSPRFELVSFEVPETVEHGRRFSVSLTARNASDTDGRFLAALYWPTRRIEDDDESTVVDRQVGAGETVTASVDLGTEYTVAEDGPVSLQLRGHVDDSAVVEVTGAGTPT